jgi:hypothetical protein
MNSGMSAPLGLKWCESVGLRKTFQILVTSVVLLLLCLPAFSQLNSGSIAGGITDQTGAVIVGARVTVTDVERGVSRPLVGSELN